MDLKSTQNEYNQELIAQYMNQISYVNRNSSFYNYSIPDIEMPAQLNKLDNVSNEENNLGLMHHLRSYLVQQKPNKLDQSGTSQEAKSKKKTPIKNVNKKVKPAVSLQEQRSIDLNNRVKKILNYLKNSIDDIIMISQMGRDLDINRRLLNRYLNDGFIFIGVVERYKRCKIKINREALNSLKSFDYLMDRIKRVQKELHELNSKEQDLDGLIGKLKSKEHSNIENSNCFVNKNDLNETVNNSKYMILNKLPNETKIELCIQNTSDHLNYAKIMDTNHINYDLNPSQNENEILIKNSNEISSSVMPFEFKSTDDACLQSIEEASLEDDCFSLFQPLFHDPEYQKIYLNGFNFFNEIVELNSFYEFQE